MRIDQQLACQTFPCTDVNTGGYAIPTLEVDPAAVRIVLISECAPADPADGYYAGPGALFVQTTLQAFRDAGAAVESIEDLLSMGVYLTSAIKCAKTGYGIATPTVQHCSHLLERELALFPNVRAYLLMGDAAIKAVNAVAKRCGERRVIPAGSTYKIRDAVYTWRGARAFPSYLQAGPSFFIEKSKRAMIAQDIAAALRV